MEIFNLVPEGILKLISKWVIENIASFPKCPRTLQDHLWLGRIEEEKMAICHFCSSHVYNASSCKSVPSMIVPCITGPNPFYTP